MRSWQEKLKGYNGKVAPRFPYITEGTVANSYEQGYKVIADRLPAKHILKKEEYIKVINTLLKKAADGVVNYDGGVVLDRVGYLCNWVAPEKTPSRGFNNNYLYSNLDNNSWLYTTALFTFIFENNPLYGWSMEGTAATAVKKSVNKEVSKGKKYKLYYRLLHDMYKGTAITYRHKRSRDKKIEKALLG